MESIRRFLSETLNYEPFEIDITIEDIGKMDQESIAKLNSYILGEDVSNYSYRDYSVKRLMDEKGFNVIASIIAISNLKKDYDHYASLYRRPIK